ncbi:probable chitinase 2 isoform X2 [Belonocnema kinseyi]|nr:probable chitinase 2 isoform X2 [Belonocnema kinseyi]
MFKLILLLGIYTAFVWGNEIPESAEEKIIGCYLETWAVYRKAEEKFDIKNIDVSLCSHLFYSFVGLGADASVRLLDPGLDIKNSGFKKFNDLRIKNPKLKTMVSMGGWNEGSVNYTKVVNNPILLEKMVVNVVEFVKKYGFSGFDLDWEYPNQRNGTDSDKKNFVLLLKKLREKFDKEDLILSVAVGASKETAEKSYDIKGISKYVHFINLMTYDFHGILDKNKRVGHNTPMHHSPKEHGEDRKLNIEYVVNYWLLEGAEAKKLILGTAFYGKSYTLADPKQVGIGAPFSGEGKIGSGAYYHICQLAKNPEWTHIRDHVQQVPYMYKEDQIIVYDDVQSIMKKAEFVLKNKLGGAFTWSVDQDDFYGNCGEYSPLLKTLNRVLRRRF